MTSTEKEKLKDEVTQLQKLSHPKIIHFIKAWHNAKKEELVFITEIMTGGSLKQYQKMLKTPQLKVIKNWCRDILEGLQYLHSQKPLPIIHRDLNCENIFVRSSTGDLRIGDLGLSAFLKNFPNKPVQETPFYMAPECFTEVYGPEADIYSFGLCLLEMCTHQTPYNECKSRIEVFNKVSAGGKPSTLDKIQDKEIKEFIELCLLPGPERPNASFLLSHKFLFQDLKTEKITPQNPVKVEETCGNISKVETCSELKEFKIDINVGFRELGSAKTSGAKIEFWFNPILDTPVSLGEELIKVFKLDAKCLGDLVELLKRKVSENLMVDFETQKLSLGRRDSRINRFNTLPYNKRH